MKILYLPLILLSIACSAVKDKPETVVEAVQLEKFNEGGLQDDINFRVWIDYSPLDIDEMYSLKGDSLTYKLHRLNGGLEKSQKHRLTAAQRSQLIAIAENIKSWDAPDECQYCQHIADGTGVIIEYKDDSNYGYRQRNLAEKGLEKELYGIAGKDSVELKNLWLLIDELKNIKD